MLDGTGGKKILTRKPPEYLSIFTTRLRCSVLLRYFFFNKISVRIRYSYFYFYFIFTPPSVPLKRSRTNVCYTYMCTYVYIRFLWNIMTLSPCPEHRRRICFEPSKRRVYDPPPACFRGARGLQERVKNTRITRMNYTTTFFFLSNSIILMFCLALSLTLSLFLWPVLVLVPSARLQRKVWSFECFFPPKQQQCLRKIKTRHVCVCRYNIYAFSRAHQQHARGPRWRIYDLPRQPRVENSRRCRRLYIAFEFYARTIILPKTHCTYLTCGVYCVRGVLRRSVLFPSRT